MPMHKDALVEACRMAPDDPVRSVAEAAPGRMEEASDLTPAAPARKRRR